MSDCKTCGKWSQYEGCAMGNHPDACNHYEQDERFGDALRARAEKAEGERDAARAEVARLSAMLDEVQGVRKGGGE